MAGTSPAMTRWEMRNASVATITIYIADACSVKQEIYRVAERHVCKGTA
jgi:hypothetical protein